MNLGEFIIKIGTKADTKELEKAVKTVEEAEKKTRRLINYLKELREATSDAEKRTIKKNFAHQVEADKLRTVISEQNAYSASLQKSMMTALKFVGAAKLALIVLDRMGNSLLKANQMYVTFNRTTGISIGRLNRMAGVANLSGMNLSAEQVAGDLGSLQQKIFGFERFGENAELFGRLQINPRGMKADEVILALRNSLKKYNGEVKTYYLNQLGLSQEWINVLELSDEKFKEYLETSNKLQLNAKERKQLAEYTAKQQKNNMRWELAKQKLLIAVMPMVQKIMEVLSEAALWVSSIFEKNPPWLTILRDVLLLFTGMKMLGAIRAVNDMIKTIKGLGLLSLLGVGAKATAKGVGGGLLSFLGLKGLGKVVGKTAAKAGARFVAGQGVAAGAGAASGGTGWAIVNAALGAWAIYDVINSVWDWWKNRDEQEKQEELTPDPDEGSPRYQYSNVRSNMTNNFFNNPQPAKEAIQQLSNYHSLILAEQFR